MIVRSDRAIAVCRCIFVLAATLTLLASRDALAQTVPAQAARSAAPALPLVSSARARARCAGGFVRRKQGFLWSEKVPSSPSSIFSAILVEAA